jgi:hypothetical protein
MDLITAALWILMNASIVADWGQTRNIATDTRTYRPYTDACTVCGAADRQEYRFKETGPARLFIGEHPSVGKVNAYFIGSLLVHNGIMLALPEKYRPYYAGVVSAYEVSAVIRNNSIGIKIDF